MSEAKAHAILISIGVSVTTAIFVGLRLLNASDNVVVAAVLLPFIVTCLLVGFVSEYFPPEKRR